MIYHWESIEIRDVFRKRVWLVLVFAVRGLRIKRYFRQEASSIASLLRRKYRNKRCF